MFRKMCVVIPLQVHILPKHGTTLKYRRQGLLTHGGSQVCTGQNIPSGYSQALFKTLYNPALRFNAFAFICLVL